MDHNFHRGLILVFPHDSFIVDKQKKVIIKSRKFLEIVNKPLLLIQKQFALGIICLSEPTKINLAKFRNLKSKHKISSRERLLWWTGKQTLYMYKIIKFRKFPKKIPIYFPKGSQVIVKPKNIQVKKFYVGTSGYYYKEWYPKGTKNMLTYYAKKLNSSYYRLPSSKTISKWKNNVTKNNDKFLFSFKANKYLIYALASHKPNKLKCKKMWNNFWKKIKYLDDNLGCILFQLSPNMKFNIKSLEILENILPKNLHVAFEFRNMSWYNLQVYTILRRNNWAFVFIHHSGWIEGLTMKLYKKTADYVYIRLHGTTDQYIGSYNKHLNKIKKSIYSTRAKQFYCYFNNTDSDDAFDDAQKFSNIIAITH